METNVSRLAKTYIHQPCVDTGRNLDALPRAMNDREDGEGESQWAPHYQNEFMIMKDMFSKWLIHPVDVYGKKKERKKERKKGKMSIVLPTSTCNCI